MSTRAGNQGVHPDYPDATTAVYEAAMGLIMEEIKEILSMGQWNAISGHTEIKVVIARNELNFSYNILLQFNFHGIRPVLARVCSLQVDRLPTFSRFPPAHGAQDDLVVRDLVHKMGIKNIIRTILLMYPIPPEL